MAYLSAFNTLFLVSLNIKSHIITLNTLIIIARYYRQRMQEEQISTVHIARETLLLSATAYVFFLEKLVIRKTLF